MDLRTLLLSAPRTAPCFHFCYCYRTYRGLQIIMTLHFWRSFYNGFLTRWKIHRKYKRYYFWHFWAMNRTAICLYFFLLLLCINELLIYLASNSLALPLLQNFVNKFGKYNRSQYCRLSCLTPDAVLRNLCKVQRDFDLFLA